MMSLLCLHLILKYLYIFKWSCVANLNENFFIRFLAVSVATLGLLFVVASHYSDHHKLSVEYHLCVGHYFVKNGDAADVTANKLKIKDPIRIFSFSSFTLIIVLATKILIFSHKNFIFKHLKRALNVLKLERLARRIKVDDAAAAHSGFKDLFVDAGTYLAMAFVAVGVIFGATQKETQKDVSFFNSHDGRLYVYFSKVLMPAVPTVILPCLLILNNGKLRQAVSRRVRQTLVFSLTAEVFQLEQLQTVHA
jgi:hypothetical protein